MQRTLLLAKIDHCILSGTHLEYVGGIRVDTSSPEAAGIYADEQVQVANVNRGERLITDGIAAPARSGTMELNGAVARLGMGARSRYHSV